MHVGCRHIVCFATQAHAGVIYIIFLRHGRLLGALTPNVLLHRRMMGFACFLQLSFFVCWQVVRF